MLSVNANDTKQVQVLLERLRKEPVGSEGSTDNIMKVVFEYLFKVPADPSDGVYHWFCQRADNVTQEAAAFLLRLFAYDSQRVDDWRTRMKSLMSSCCDCVRELQEAKRTSQETYLAVFPPKTRQTFMRSFSSWETSLFLDGLASCCISLEGITSPTDVTLLDAPPALIYLALSNLDIFQDNRVLSIIARYVPSQPISWPPDPPPPGLFYLLFHENATVRHWAEQQLLRCQHMPMSVEKIVRPYLTAFKAVLDTLTAREPTTDPSSSSAFPFSQDTAVIWSGFLFFLRLLPPEFLKPGGQFHVDLSRIIASHLHDTGPQFTNVLRCYVFLLRQIGADIWSNESSDYPQVVFDAIKDNPCFTELVRGFELQDNEPWVLLWFPDFLYSIWTQETFDDVLVKMVDFLCEELQHERFQDVRPAAMLVAADLLRSILSKSESEKDISRRTAALHSLDIHVDHFVTVAFSRAYSGPEWAATRTSIRVLVSQVSKMSYQNISTTITHLSQAASLHELETTVPDVRKQTWAKIFGSIQPHDSDAILTMISIAAPFAHLCPLTKSAFAPVLNGQGSRARVAFDEVNSALLVFRSGYSEVISKYANYNSSAAIETLLRRPGVAKDVAVLMLCPSEGLQGAAQALVGQAFDADVRVECFHAMLRNLLDATLQGIFTFMETFMKYAVIVPEACDISKALVRCLTDVIEVLCSSPDSLLLDNQLLKSDNGTVLRVALPKFWTLMTESISIIFRKTPAWSVYFDAEDMIRWMRDALIFGRDMLAQWRVIESAVVSHVDPPPSQKPSKQKLSRIGKKMIDDLQQFLPELIKWLRLTDEELLHQSFALLQSLLDCFKKIGVRPSEMGIQKLTRHIEGSRNKGAKMQTRLDSARILKLEATLGAFEDDDVVELVSHIPPNKAVQQKRPNDNKPIVGTSADPSGRTTAPSMKPSVSSKAPIQPTVSRQSGFLTTWDQAKLSKDPGMPRLQLPASSSSRNVPPKDARQTSPVAKQSSSDEDSSDEGSDRESGLAALGKFQRTPQLKKPVERRQMKVLELPTLVNNSAFRRMRERDDARRAALRMKPDISGLHRTILSWAYDHSGPDPPSNDFKAPLVRVPDRFLDYSHYHRVFEPLLLLECWAQIVQSKDESTEMFESKIISRQFVDDFVDFDLAIVEPLRKGWSLSDTDIILLRLTGGNHSVMGKVLNFKSNTFTQQHVSQSAATVLQHAVQVSVRCHFGKRGDPGLQIGTTCRIGKVFSLSTLHREYAALMAMPHYDCADFILKPQLPKPTRVDQKEVQLTMTKYNVNEPQARAIASALRTDGFSLIQGPPGTGKTSTICGLVQAFLSNRPQLISTNGSRDKNVSKKILLCAPSNAAIDEIANRLKEGVSGAGRRSVIPKVVRIGTDKVMNVSVKDISLNNLIDQKLDSSQSVRAGFKDSASEIALLRSELEAVRQSRQQKQAELADLHDNVTRSAALDEEIKRLNYRRVTIIQKLDRLRDQQKSDNRTLDAVRRKFRMEVLAEADIICSTLSGSGHDSLEALEFDMIIIDEAVQAIELSSLIPLKYNVARCVMVGDPQQLPPTVISQEATKYFYNQSLFVRLQKLHPDAVHLLSIQYRMHPDISQLPSRVFYGGLLKDGPGMTEKTARPWHASNMFGPYRFLNILRGRETPGPSHSLMNQAEVQVAVALYARLLNEFSSVDFNFRVGVVSMYRAQILELRRAFESRFGADVTSQVDFNTVDGFQGQEKDIIILSCVRAGPGLQNVGFLSDARRMNVALTRARASLFVLGHCPTLERSDKTWQGIITDARERACLIEVSTCKARNSSRDGMACSSRLMWISSWFQKRRPSLLNHLRSP
ncbi:SEN1 N terminal-domain-containing protein [Multifurca ochricompacta]|uniref:SEN1 N terminal-domain-containing protein n=1 Tax=Multifurca ochricompacta TaxID=376703 RepID=A0AAD4M6Z3_9AGAM|nr:SEN1 N terminal-domain-containing protein [Multifurca ochricompacta]